MTSPSPTGPSGEIKDHTGALSDAAPKVETTGFGQTLLVNSETDRAATEKPGGDSMTVPEQFGRYRIERELGRGAMGLGGILVMFRRLIVGVFRHGIPPVSVGVI